MKHEFGDDLVPGSPEAAIVEAIDGERLPRHVAVIMDGNGRWAARRHLPRVDGHRAGVKAVRATVEAAARLGVGVLTLFAFSRENWRRPKDEVDTLMGLLRGYVTDEMRFLKEHGIRLRIVGRRRDLPEDVREALAEAEAESAPGAGLIFNVALSYGGRTEIADACTAVLEERAQTGVTSPVSEAEFERHLYTAGLPDPDLVIRTSGEHRLSNFLLWQAAYAEFWTTDILWPDFQRRDLLRAILDYQQRDRRYGGVAGG